MSCKIDDACEGDSSSGDGRTVVTGVGNLRHSRFGKIPDQVPSDCRNPGSVIGLGHFLSKQKDFLSPSIGESCGW
jgi:hypothetical protein